MCIRDRPGVSRWSLTSWQESCTILGANGAIAFANHAGALGRQGFAEGDCVLDHAAMAVGIVRFCHVTIAVTGAVTAKINRVTVTKCRMTNTWCSVNKGGILIALQASIGTPSARFGYAPRPRISQIK